MSSWLRVEGLTVDFGRTRALDSVSFDVAPDSVVAVQGANGAGKSTLLWALAGLILPTSGRLTYPGENCRIGFLAHQNFLYEELTVLENLILSARLSDVSDPAARARDMMGELELEAQSGRRVSELSRGQQQLAAIARTLVVSPDLILLDEPFSNLDANGVERVLRIITSLRSPTRLILLATHDLSASHALATHVLELNGGRSAPVRPLSA